MLGATAGDALAFKVTNPVTNTFAITSFTLTAPSGFVITAWPTPGGCIIAVGGGSVACGALNIVPGSNLAFAGTVTAPAPTGANVYPQTYSWTSVVQDASGVGYYVGPSLSTTTMDPNTVVTVTDFTSASFVAGSAALSMTATITQPGGQAAAQAGLTIVWSITAGVGCGYTGLLATCPTYTGGVYTLTSSSTTNGGSPNTASATFAPSNHATDHAQVTATVGSSAVAGTTASTLTTSPGSPGSVVWTRNAGTAFGSAKKIYISGTAACGGAGTVCFATPTFTGATKSAEYAGGAAGFAVSVADGFGNTFGAGITGPTSGPLVAISSATGIGVFDNGGASGLTTVFCTSGAGTGATCTLATGSAFVSINYFQSYTWGATGVLSAAVNGMYAGNAFSVSGLSGTVLTGTESTTVAGAISPLNTATTPVVGTAVTFTATLGGGSTQPGVPVTIELCIKHAPACPDTPAGYGGSPGQGSFTGGSQSVTVNSLGPSGTGAGTASAKYTVDQSTGPPPVSVDLNATIPVTPVLTGATGTATTANILVGPTFAGPAAGLLVKAYFDIARANPVGSKLATGITPLYVCIGLVDQYLNPTTNTLVSQIQVTLTPSSGSLTSSNPYIASGASNTCTGGSFGNDQWNLPTTLALGSSLTLGASATLSGATPNTATKTMTIVSQSPTIAVKTTPAQVGGWIYSNTGAVAFTTSANVSAGLSGAVTIASIGYKVNNNPWKTAATPGLNVNTGILTSLFFAAGVSTVAFNATDSTTAANTAVSSTFNVLVDSSPPTITATTAAGAQLTGGAPVVYSIVDAQGDLDSTSVKATYNGTAVAASAITVTGTNNPGHSVTYTVNVAGIPTGHWSVTLSAKDLAGNTASSVSVLVYIIVPFATSVVVSGTPAKTTIGGFTGVQATYTNNWNTAQSLIVFAVWKNAAGQTVAVTSSGLTLAAGASGTAFAPLSAPLPTGSYSVNIFVWTTNNQPVSITTTITASF